LLTAGTVIVTAEEIVPELLKADLIGPLVHHIVIAPKGARPTSCHPLYPVDGEAILDYSERVTDANSFRSYLKEWLEQ
jgi:hypothetical protein